MGAARLALLLAGLACSQAKNSWSDAVHARRPRQSFDRSVLGSLKPGLQTTGTARPPRTHEFVSTIALGTPPQKLTCLVDTGVSDVWVIHKTGCTDCISRGRFDVNKSTTFSGMSSTEAHAPWYLGEHGGELLSGLPFKDTLGMGPMELHGQGVMLMTSVPEQAHDNKGTDWDSVCGLGWPKGGDIPDMAVNMIRANGHAVFTLAPGLGDRSFVVAGEIPQTIYKPGTLAWAKSEPVDQGMDRQFWLVSGKAGFGRDTDDIYARFLIDSGTSFIYMPPDLFFKEFVPAFFDRIPEKKFGEGCGIDPAAGNLLVCDCSVTGHLESNRGQMFVSIGGGRFKLDVATLFEKVSAKDGKEDLCLPLVQPNTMTEVSLKQLERIENVADQGRGSSSGSAAARSMKDEEWSTGDAAAAVMVGGKVADPTTTTTTIREAQTSVWILGGAFLEKFVVVLDFDEGRLGVAEPMVNSEPALTDPELVWFRGKYKRLEDLDAKGDRMCAEEGSLKAPCGACGPDWGDALKCQALCSADARCNYVVHSTDGGCRLYSSCVKTVSTHYNGSSSAMHIYAKQTIPYKQVVADERALCSDEHRIVNPCGSCGPDWGDKAQCERMCNSNHRCNYFTYINDGGIDFYGTCKIYEDCLQFVTAEDENVTTEIYWKVTPFIFDDKQKTRSQAQSAKNRPGTWGDTETLSFANRAVDVGADMAQLAKERDAPVTSAAADAPATASRAVDIGADMAQLAIERDAPATSAFVDVPAVASRAVDIGADMAQLAKDRDAAGAWAAAADAAATANHAVDLGGTAAHLAMDRVAAADALAEKRGKGEQAGQAVTRSADDTPTKSRSFEPGLIEPLSGAEDVGALLDGGVVADDDEGVRELYRTSGQGSMPTPSSETGSSRGTSSSGFGLRSLAAVSYLGLVAALIVAARQFVLRRRNGSRGVVINGGGAGDEEEPIVAAE